MEKSNGLTRKIAKPRSTGGFRKAKNFVIRKCPARPTKILERRVQKIVRVRVTARSLKGTKRR